MGSTFLRNTTALAIVSCVLIVSCCCLVLLPCFLNNPTAISRQRTVDAMRALTQDLKTPEHFLEIGGDAARTGEEFDVNEYFAILDRLSMEPGYTLDYVYWNDSGHAGYPCLYARPMDKPRYLTYSEYSNAIGDTTSDEGRERFWYGYMDHIQVEDSEEGFFQFVVLRMMGGQFYRYWHAHYSDIAIACTREGLVSAFPTPFELVLLVPLETQLRIRGWGLAPSVRMEQDTVLVRVIYFAEGGGCIQASHTISRSFPHKVLDLEIETLVPWIFGPVM